MDQIPVDLGATAVTVGNFDGVHRGHQAVLQRLTRRAHERGLVPVAITFDPHPAAVLAPERAPTTVVSLGQRLAALEAQGVEAVLVVEFTREFAAWTPGRFVQELLVDTLHAGLVVVGADTRFGHRNAGDVGTLRALGADHGFDVEVLDDLGGEGPEESRWSSSLVRGLLARGDVTRAASVLGRAHVMRGRVVHGDHRGRELGFPTANLSPDAEGMVPGDGVYAGWLVRTGPDVPVAERRLPAAVSIGTNPTFDGTGRRVESYVLDRTDLDLYGEQVEVEFVELLRPTVRFDSLDDLVVQMHDDVARCRTILGVPGTARRAAGHDSHLGPVPW